MATRKLLQQVLINMIEIKRKRKVTANDEWGELIKKKIIDVENRGSSKLESRSIEVIQHILTICRINL